MKTLNCKRMPQMIPLYVAGDLVGQLEREVAAHLAECASCRELAEEFSDSLSLVTQALTPPVFGAEFYSEIRSTVLGEIKRERMRSKPSLFRRSWVYATAFGLIIIASAVMLQYFSTTRRQTPLGPSFTVRATVQPPSGQANGTNSPAPPELTDTPKSPRKSPRLPGALRIRSDKTFALVKAGRSFRQIEITRKGNAPIQTAPNESTQIAAARESLSSASTDVGPAALESAPVTTLTSGRAPSSQIARIEIQTSDPNIRIIWLGSRDSHEGEGSKNANRK